MVALSRCLALTALAAASLLLSLPAFAQDVAGPRSFSGVVVDAYTGEALPGVNVVISAERGLGGATDEDGRFAIGGLPPGAFVVRFSYVGYEPDSLRIDLHRDSFRARVALHSKKAVLPRT